MTTTKKKKDAKGRFVKTVTQPSTTASHLPVPPTVPEPRPLPPQDTAEEITIKKSLLLDLQKTLESNQKDIELLKSVADKRALARYYDRNKEQLPPEVRVRTLPSRDKDGNPISKLILGWRTVKDDVYKDPRSQRWVEEQIIELVFEDGTTQELTLLDFNRRFEHIKCKRIGIISDDASKLLSFKLIRLDNGEALTIGAQFVN